MTPALVTEIDRSGRDRLDGLTTNSSPAAVTMLTYFLRVGDTVGSIINSLLLTVSSEIGTRSSGFHLTMSGIPGGSLLAVGGTVLAVVFTNPVAVLSAPLATSLAAIHSPSLPASP